MRKAVWKNWINIVLGFWLVLLPFLGFPRGWKDFFMALAGLIVALLSLGLSRLYSDKMLEDESKHT